MIAALFVESQGIYSDMPGVDPWDIERDARKYKGPHPVVAHPPCKRWGRFWSGGPSAKVRRKLGDDGGCFPAALYAVRQFGGVLEHPEASKAWEVYGIDKPPWRAGWVPANDGHNGWTCCVAQGNYGHPSRKLTWLYAVGVVRPELDWSIPVGMRRLDDGFHSAKERALGRRTSAMLSASAVGRLTRVERLATPPAFAEVLVTMARTAHAGRWQ